jgi:hypothetical protein
MMYIALIIMFVIAAITWTIGQSLAETPPHNFSQGQVERHQS